MDNYKTAAGADPMLAAKFYPSGTKREATSICLCGAVEIRIVTESPLFSGFCHCIKVFTMSLLAYYNSHDCTT